MNRNEQQMYSDITSIRKSLEKIANVLEHMNHDSYLAKQEIPKFQDIPGFEGTKDALDNLCNVSTKDEEYDFDVHNDYLNDLVQGMNQIEYLQFHNQMNFSFASNDSTAMSDAIYELEYEECLGAIQTALLITGDSDYIAYAGGDKEAGRNFVIETLKNENTTQPTNDPYTYEPNPNRDKGEPALLEYLDGIKNDSDHDIRTTARMYEEELEAGNFKTKKECILDYVTNEFGSHGARYTDIIKFAYYLNNPNSIKFDSTRDRGYYACAMTHNRWKHGHLVRGGKDFLVKGINKEGNERYFALSFVESATDYWKYCDNTK